MPVKILVVDDDPRQPRQLAALLEAAGYAVELAGGGREALDRLRRANADVAVCLLDLKTSQAGGLEVLEQARAAGVMLPVIALASEAREHAGARAAIPRERSHPFYGGDAGEPGGAETRDPLVGADGHIRPLRQVEADTIRLALRLYRGRMAEAARRLGIGRSTLYRKIDELQLDRNGSE